MDVALNSSVWVSSPEFAGWLQKRGFHWRKLWKLRWVALHGAEIVYMDKEPTLENSSTMVMTKAQITSATIIEPDDIEGDALGFKVNINNGKSPTWCLRADSDLEKKNWLTRLNHVIQIVRWLEEYEKVRVLGVGGTGVVYELLHKTNGRKFAMKEMEIKNKAQMQMALQEAEMLKDIMENISHPNIIHIEKVFQVGSKFYLVFPLCTGGELYEHIIRRGCFTEFDAALLTRDLVGGIHALHEEDILHLDIKPENILFDSNDADAKIKITDFGLSRVLDGEVGTGSPPMPSKVEMDDKVIQFFENGVLNRERLRGTVGYMSPELILCGHCSKATDIFAAGVVLYILLCGRPPFQSKSNREVLERTCRGQYTMDGPQWQDVSEEAKELVKSMLITDPSKRITAAQVLDHPWLKNLDENLSSSTSAFTVAAAIATQEVSPIKQAAQTTPRSQSKPVPISKRKGSGVSLGSLRILSGHVQARRSEKLASSFTRLVSSLQSGAWTNTSLLCKQIELADGSPLPESACRDEDMMILQNPDIRQALTTVFEKVCTDGKMPIDHFLGVLRHFGMGPGPTSGPVSGLPGLFLCRFIDRDGDGYISADDIFTTQALVMMKSELFMRAVFRMYTEAVWYPGRQLNLASYNRSPRKAQSPQSGRSAVLDRPEANNTNDVVEPPKFITHRHVAEVFSKIGYKADTGKKIFSILCAALKRKRDLMERSDSTNGDEGGVLRPVRYSRDNLNELGNAKSESLGHDDSFDMTNMPLAQANLLSEFAKAEISTTSANLPPLAPPEKVMSKQPFSEWTVGEDEGPDNEEEEVAKLASSSSSAKMDVHDFMDACQLDDVLIQAVLRKPRQRFLELLAKMQSTSAGSTGDTAKSYGSDNSERTTEMDAAMGHGIDTSALEEQLVTALALAEEESKSAFPLASNLINSGKNSLLDLAVGFTSSASNLMGQFTETIHEAEGEESSPRRGGA
jgi:calcium/calmodulin-dependent protein kinase I